MTTSTGGPSTSGASPICAAPAVTRPARGEDGVAAVEFALVLPILLTLLMGIIDWGYFFFVSETVVNAAREGARAGVVEPLEADAKTTAETRAKDYLSYANVKTGVGNNLAKVTVTAPVAGPTAKVIVKVEVPTFKALTGFLAAPLIPSSISYTSTMRWESAK